MATKKSKAVVTPELTEKMKLIAMTFQRDMLQLAQNIQDGQKKLDEQRNAFGAYLNTVASELKIDTNLWVFALDTLTLVPKK